MTDDPKFCSDCAHFDDRGYCDRLAAKGHREPVYGRWVYNECTAEAQRFWPWLCGKKGRHFQPKVTS
jgi:hypothetical protein